VSIQLSATLWKEDSIFIAKCAELDVASDGKTPDEALANLKEALELWIENAKTSGILDDYSAVLNSTSRFMSYIELDI